MLLLRAYQSIPMQCSGHYVQVPLTCSESIVRPNIHITPEFLLCGGLVAQYKYFSSTREDSVSRVRHIKTSGCISNLTAASPYDNPAARFSKGPEIFRTQRQILKSKLVEQQHSSQLTNRSILLRLVIVSLYHCQNY